MRILIVGGVAGGASTAARLRRLNENAEIIIFERGAEISYANCGIPYHIGNVIQERENLVLVNQKYFKDVFNIEVRTKAEVVSIDRANKKIKVNDLKNQKEYTENYDFLVLSPGAQPVRPTIPGIDDRRIFTLRTLEDMDNIKNFIAGQKCRKAAVIGAGFIGLEMAENLAHLGLQVNVIEQAEQVMTLLDYEMATYIHQELRRKNVGLYLKDSVTGFVDKSGLKITMKSGRQVEADIVILSIGVRPEKKLAVDAGLEIGSLGGIKVNKKMQTNDPAIYALGDATEIIDSVCGCQALIPLANSANKQGRIVAENICGAENTYDGTPGTAIAKIFDQSVAIVGSSEKTLKRRGTKYSKIYLYPSSHAGYYPGAKPLIMKLIYAPGNGQLLGAQIIGPDGVDKRIDVLAVLVQQQQTVYDLAKLELAYAPPFSSAKDPVNLAGMIAINELQGKNPVVHWDQVDDLCEAGCILLDVRTPLEFKLGHIEGSLNIPLAELRARIAELSKDKQIITICNQGKSAYFALTYLQNLGYQVKNLSGGYKLYQSTKLPQENTDIEKYYIDKREELNIMATPGKTVGVDACGLQCPGPIMRLAKEINLLNVGDVLEMKASDPGFFNDVGAWCDSTGNKLLSKDSKDGLIYAKIQKGILPERSALQASNDKTLIVFSGDLDKAIASFIIANGAVSLGRKVTMFFTFWGLNTLRRDQFIFVKKGLLDHMFGLMMPRGSKKLGLSRMNMLGMGALMIRYVMNKKHVDSLEDMLKAALAGGVRIIACQMSMDVMGIKKEELIDGIEIGGVANYLNAAEKSDTNLFV